MAIQYDSSLTGSAASTGSFGRIEVPNNSNLNKIIVGANDGGKSLNVDNSIYLSSGNQVTWANGDARIIEGSPNNYDLKLGAYNGSSFNDFVIGGSTTGNVFSGSATSTGSFGYIHMNKSSQIGEYFRAGEGVGRYLSISAVSTTNVGDTHVFNAASSTGHLKFQTTSADRMTINSSGVGIGTTTPNFPLNVHITASNVALASFHGTGNSALSTPIGITFGTRTDAGSGTTDQRAGVFYEYNGNLFLAAKSGVGDLATSPKQYAQLYVDGANDRVGIGDTSPGASLVVVSSAGNTARFGSTSDGVNLGYGSGFGFIQGTDTEGSGFNHLRFRTASDYGMILTTGNLVGIGTMSPSAKLAISGSGDSTSNELSIESDVYPILRFKSNANNANNREFRFASVYNSYGKFEILSATNNTGAATTTRLSISGTTGDIEFPTANAKLSGSATSTGSFGALEIAGDTIKTDSGGRTTFIGDNAEVISVKSNDSNGSHIIFEEGTTARGYVGIAGGILTSGGDNFGIRSEADLLLATNGNNTRVTINSSGNVGIGDTSPTEGKLVVAGDGAYNSPPLHITMTTSTTFNHFANMVDSNLTAGENGIIVFGQELDSNNSAYIGYKHRSDHGNDNQLTLGFWGSNNLVNLLPNGNLGIGTETPGAALEVIGSVSGSATSTGSFGNLQIDGKATINPNRVITAGESFAALNLSAGQGSAGNYRDIDIIGAWTNNETHNITFSHGSSEGNMVGQIRNHYHGSGSSFFMGRLYHGGDSTFFPFRIDSLSTTTARMSFDGNVGIGTASPLSPLHQVGSGTTYPGDIRVGGSSTAFGVEIKYDQSGATTGTIYSSPGYGNDNALLKIGVDSGGTNQLVLKGDGNVGIGTASPSVALEVIGEISSSGAGHFSNITLGGTEQIAVNNGNLYYTGGSLGIGTSSPGVALLNVFSSTAGAPFLYVGDGTPNNDSSWDANIMLDSNQHSRFRIENRGDNKNLQITSHVGYEPAIYAVDSATSIRFGVGGTQSVEITATGVSGSAVSTGSFARGHFADKVGIGTTSPNRLLTIVGSSAAINLDSPDNAFIHVDRGAVDDVAEITFRTGGANKYFVGLGDSGNFSDGSEFFIGEGSGGSGNRRITLDSTGETTFTSNNATVEIATTSNGTYGVRSTSPAKFNDYYFNGTTGHIRNTLGTAYMSFGSSGQVGIGTTSPDGNLHIFSGSAGTVTAHGNGDELVIEGSASEVGMTFLGSTSSNQNILFGDPDDHKSGYIVYAHSTDSMTFGTAANHRMFISGSGNVGIGTTSPQTKFHVKEEASSTDLISKFEATGDVYLQFAANNELDWAIIHGYPDTTDFNLYNYSNNRNDITVLDANGNVGIGQTNPQNLLQVGDHVHVSSSGLVGIGLAAPETDLHISNASPAIRFTDENVSNLKHQIIGGGDAGLEYSADFNNVAAGYHRWDISGAEKMRLKESGHLGIGTSDPGKLLTLSADVSGETQQLLIVNKNDSDGDTSGILFGVLDDATYAKAGIFFERTHAQARGSLHFATDSATDSGHAVKANARMTIDKDGNVGIGTTSPTTFSGFTTVHHKNSSGDTIMLGESDGGVISQIISSDGNSAVFFGARSNHALTFTTNDTRRITVDTSGNVGIGHTGAPNNSAKLGVAGNLNIGNGQSSAIAYFENSGTDAYIEGNASKLNLGIVGQTQHVSINASGDITLSDGDVSGSATSTASFGTVQTYGNVGIGTTTPTHTLHAISTDNKGFFLDKNLGNNADTLNEFSAYYSLSIKNRNAGSYLNFGGDANRTDIQATDGGASATAKILALNPFGGNVGIGTTSPNYPIDLQTSDSPATLNLKVNAASTTDDYAEIAFQLWSGAGSGANTFGGSGDSRPSVVLRALNENGSSAAGAFVVGTFTGGSTNSTLTEKFRISSGGNVGIGESAPGYPLEVVGATGNTVAKFGETMALHMIHNAPVLGFNLYYNGGYKFGEGSSSSYGGYIALSTGTGTFKIATSNAGNAGGAATITERVTILNSGNVGIGETSPDVPLSFGVTSLNEQVIKLRQNSNSKTGLGITANYGVRVFGPSDATSTGANFEVGHVPNASVPSTNFTSSFMVLYNGNVGVGGTPSQKFDVSAGHISLDQSYNLYLDGGSNTYVTSNASDQIALVTNGTARLIVNNTKISGSATSTGSFGHLKANSIDFEDGFGASYIKYNSADIAGDGSPSLTIGDVDGVNTGAKLTFDVTNAEANFTSMNVNAPIVRGTTCVKGPNGSESAPSFQFNTAHDGFFHDSGIKVITNNSVDFLFGDSGDFHADADVVAYSTSVSDKKLKDNIKTIEFGLDKIKNLRGVEFTWNNGGREGQRDIGLIAQEIEKVIPEVVREKEMPLMDDSGKKYKTIDYDKITAVLIEAVKEQQEQIDELKRQVKELRDGSPK